MASHSVKLQSGAQMPLLGLGTLMAKDQEVIHAVLKALELGYRHIDTAYVYRNESAIGEALQIAFKKAIVKREEIFVTTKLPSNGHQPDKVAHFLKKSLKNLQLDYVDLYLVHSPITFKYKSDDEHMTVENGKAVFDNVNLVSTWKAMEALVDGGLARDIGLSNFNSQQVQLIYDNARIKPSNNQVEGHIYLQQEKLFAFCKERGISLTAYAPFGSPKIREWRKSQYNVEVPEQPSILENKLLIEIGKKYNKSSSQVALRCLIQRGIIVIPKSSNPARLQQNIEIFDFELTEEEMGKIRTLDAGIRVFDSNIIPGMKDHPNYPYNMEF